MSRSKIKKPVHSCDFHSVMIIFVLMHFPKQAHGFDSFLSRGRELQGIFHCDAICQDGG